MSETLDRKIEDSEVLELRELLCNWLDAPDWQESQLIEWLQGNCLPALDLDEEPYESLLQGLPLADERYRAETELARRAARLLESPRTVDGSRDGRDKLLYNLLMLSAGLSSPTQLAEPLYEMFQRRRLEGEWQGINLRQALESALITNQRDSRLEDVWLEMLKQRRHDFLTGDEYAGFEGIRLMPASDATRGEPALDAIGTALAAMAAHLEKRRDRRVVFHQLINRVLRTYPGRPTWDNDLVYQAHKNDWPGWAVECLPRLFFTQTNSDLANADTRAVVWHYILACVPVSHEYEISSALCSDRIFEVTLSQSAFHFTQSIAPVLEHNRLSMPYASERAMQGSVADSMAQLEVEARSRNDMEAASALQHSRRQILKRAGILPNVERLGSSLRKIAEDREPEQNRETGFITLVASVVELYPDLNLKREAEEMELPSWAANCIERAA